MKGTQPIATFLFDYRKLSVINEVSNTQLRATDLVPHSDIANPIDCVHLKQQTCLFKQGPEAVPFPVRAQAIIYAPGLTIVSK